MADVGEGPPGKEWVRTHEQRLDSEHRLVRRLACVNCLYPGHLTYRVSHGLDLPDCTLKGAAQQFSSVLYFLQINNWTQ